MHLCFCHFIFFFFIDTATTEIYTLSLHDALPISLTLDDLQQGAMFLTEKQGGSDVGLTTTIAKPRSGFRGGRSEEHTSELQSQSNLVCRLLLEKKNKKAVQDQHEHTTDALQQYAK